MDTIQEFAPYIIIAIVFIIQNKIFVTPAQLLEKTAEIYREIDNKYVTKSEISATNASIEDIKEKTDKIYDIIIQRFADHNTHEA